MSTTTQELHPLVVYPGILGTERTVSGHTESPEGDAVIITGVIGAYGDYAVDRRWVTMTNESTGPGGILVYNPFPAFLVDIIVGGVKIQERHFEANDSDHAREVARAYALENFATPGEGVGIVVHDAEGR